MKPPLPYDPWRALTQATPARIALGRTGASLPTNRVLEFALDHARARDAVHAVLDVQAMGAAFAALGREVLEVDSAASDRATYLLRPDLGRRLSDDSRLRLDATAKKPCDVAIVVADGLSATAVTAHAAPLVAILAAGAGARGWTLGPVVLARQARVALGDEVGALLGARLTILLVGERPGLSSPDSLGAYLTLAPRVGRTDAERNCVSNIRPAGLSYDAAAGKILWLADEALRRGYSGVDLKDDSDLAVIAPGDLRVSGPDQP